MHRKTVKLHHFGGSLNLYARLRKYYEVPVCLDGLRDAGLLSSRDYHKYVKRKEKEQDFVLTASSRRFAGSRALVFAMHPCRHTNHDDAVLRCGERNGQPCTALLTTMQTGWLWDNGLRSGDKVYMKLEAV